MATREFGLNDIQFAVSDQEVRDGDENADADARQKSNQRDDSGDDQDKDVVAEVKTTADADQPFVQETEREQEQKCAHHDLGHKPQESEARQSECQAEQSAKDRHQP